MKKVSGIIRVHPRGFGFVAGKKDIFVPKPFIGDAVDGDTVEVEITAEREKGPEGRVIAILKRGRKQLGARIVSTKGQIVAYAPLLGPDRYVIVKKHKLKVGDRVLLNIDQWGEDEIHGHVAKVLGHISNPACDVEAACKEFEIKDVFSKSVVKEAASFGTKVSSKGRVDFRDLPCVTIDPASARDFDDALSVSKSGKGFQLVVHIADVSHYVKQGSALDNEASRRCNSTYFPGVCVPMLPPSLSNELCSLQPKVNRLAISVVMQFNQVGDLKKHEIKRSVICSQKRFTYEEAKEVLDGKRKSQYAPMLRDMVKLCDLLKKKRRERGSVEFALPEVFLEVDEKGVPKGTRLIEYDITHQMVEEFMLKANEVVATHLTKLGRGLTYRIHEAPGERDLEGFYQMAAAFGYKLPKKPAMEDLQRLFDQARNEPHSAQLAVSFIRSMKMAIYSPDNIGHYGLSLEHYCHFTSPIRRYADLLIHRILFEKEAYTEPQISEIAKHCSDQERVSSRAENSVLHLKKLRYLKQQKKKEWNAVVSKIKPFGIIFEVVELSLEGFIHISEIGDDYYIFDERRGQLIGDHSGETFVAGTDVMVRVLDIDLITEQVIWEMY